MGGTRGKEDMGGRRLAERSPPFLSRERAAGSVDVDPEHRSTRYHETCLSLESVEESRAAVWEPCGAWLRLLVIQDLEVACRPAVRMQKQ